MKHLLCLLACFAGLTASAQVSSPANGSPGPEIAAWLIGAEQATLAAGEPLRIGVEISLATETAAPLTLASDGNDWRTAVRVELLPKAGGTALAAQPAGTFAEKSVTVTPEESARGTWWISSRALAALTAGDYSVRVRLARPALTADPVAVTLSGREPPADSAAFLLAQAHEDVLAGQPEAAAKRLDAVLEKDASNIQLLVFRAQLALSVGDARSARACLIRARRVAALDRDSEPSTQLDELFRRLDSPASSDTSTPANTPPPAWSRPPALVFAPVIDDAALATATAATPAGKVATRATATATPTTNSSAPTQTDSGSTNVAPAASVAPAALNTAVQPTAPAPSASEPIPANLPGKIVPATELADLSVIADGSGQWATSAKASSQYGAAASYSPAQATGAPNVTYAGNDPASWCPATKGSGSAWLEVTFARPANATGVRVRQNNAPGAIMKVEAIDTDGRSHLWWQGKDPFVVGRVREITWLGVAVPKTDYAVAAIRLTLDLAAVADWTEIDAVQLVGGPR